MKVILTFTPAHLGLPSQVAKLSEARPYGTTSSSCQLGTSRVFSDVTGFGLGRLYFKDNAKQRGRPPARTGVYSFRSRTPKWKSLLRTD